MATSDDWSVGYARQAKADFAMYQALQGIMPEFLVIEWCHRLQFLQMACEKLAKAHLCGGGADPASFQNSHVFVAKVLPLILRQTASERKYAGKEMGDMLRLAKQMAQEIEILAPAVKRGGQRPDNCEYPWEDTDGSLRLPLDWQFSLIGLLFRPQAFKILKLIECSIENLLR